MLFLPQRSSLLSFPSWWLLILCDIVSGAMRFLDWSVDPHTAQGHSSSCLGTDMVWALIYMSVNNPICWLMSGFFHLFSQWEHVASIVSLARFSHFNPPCECRKGEKERWECQQGSTQQLRVINHCHDRERETEDERQERWSAADIAGISRQRWDESTYPAAMLYCWYKAVTSHPARHQRALSQWCRRVSQNGEEVHALCSHRQTYMDYALKSCQSLSSQRPRISHYDNRVMHHVVLSVSPLNISRTSNLLYTWQMYCMFSINKLSITTRTVLCTASGTRLQGSTSTQWIRCGGQSEN